VPKAGLRKIQRYSLEFKLTAVRLSQQPGIQVQAVAAALDIHPFMLSKWRKEVRLGMLHGKGGRVLSPPVREIRRLQELERAYGLLRQEHELLKKAIRFCSARRQSDSRSSRRSAAPSR
jgi:transposase